MIWTYIKGAGLLAQLVGVVSIVTLVGTGYGIWHHKIYKRGADDTIAAIARADAKVIAKAVAARSKLTECQTLNRQWDQSTGKCL